MFSVDLNETQTVKYMDGLRIMHPELSSWILHETSKVSDFEVDRSGQVAIGQVRTMSKMDYINLKLKQITKQAGAELGQAQSQLGLGYI